MTLTMAEFQQAAVDLIVERLTDASGSRRFLLADEVGLGKTIVARGVIDALAKKKRRPLVVVYLCSSVEIGEQNRSKLCPESATAVRRATELALKSTEPDSQRVQLYTFTSGTTLKPGTGLRWERQMVLYLVGRILRKPIRRWKWRRFFCCTANETCWREETRPKSLIPEFRAKIHSELQEAVAARWAENVELDEGSPVSLSRVLETEVERFAAEEDRRRRNKVVSLLRFAVQREAVRHLRPDLVILDEVQRFKEVLKQANKPDQIASQLLSRRDTAALILSATPYKLLSLRHEEENHYEDFLETIGFLNRNTPQDELQRQLSEFRKRLEEGKFLTGRDDELRRLKLDIERDLRRVVSRTERYRYIRHMKKGVEEHACAPEEQLASDDLTEFLALRKLLLEEVQSGHQITDYWKSAPSVLTFMDSQYALLRHVRDDKRDPGELVASEPELDALATKSQRVRTVFRRFFGDADPRESWRHLWIAPTYRYWKGGLFSEDGSGSSKLLVFSHWRFVPKALSILISRRIERLLPLLDPNPNLPLRFSDRSSFHVFDVCLPATSLALRLDPARLHAEGRLESARDLVRLAETRLRGALEEAGVTVDGTGQLSTWEALAKLEAKSPHAQNFREAFKAWHLESPTDITGHMKEHRTKFLEAMDDKRPGRLSEKRLKRLARMACFSPAVSLLRALASVYGIDSVLGAKMVGLCLGPLRNYLNRPLVQAVIRSSFRARSYGEQVLEYSKQAHLQAVLDEYAFLLGDQFPGAPEDALEVLEHVFGLGTGTPSINTVRGRGTGMEWKTATVSTHVALAFGEETRSDVGPPEDASATTRPTWIREAFNSPFWPFVLTTTSRGQEGLDFHLYCRDLVHWNLPSNPVDLEQREGRINRRACLTVRRNVARDWTLARAFRSSPVQSVNPWSWVFASAQEEGKATTHRHGLHPFWLYDVRSGATESFNRHLVFFESSAEKRRYARLKEQLALYRLVFGQPRQADLLEAIHRKIAEGGTDGFQSRLPDYMIDLSPLGPEHAWRRARKETREILTSGPMAIERLVAEVQRIVREHPAELGAVRSELKDLIAAAMDGAMGKRKSRVRAIAALAYLVNPFDGEFDFHPDYGFDDDLAVIRDAHRALTARQPVTPA